MAGALALDDAAAAAALGAVATPVADGEAEAAPLDFALDAAAG